MEIEELQGRIESVLNEKQVLWEVKIMFGGLCFMVDNKMCFGIYRQKKTQHYKLIARVGDDFYKTALIQPFCSAFTLTGRTMKGFVFVEKEGIESLKQLDFWIEKCLEYNPMAKKNR